MKLKQHRADMKALKEMNCSGIADRVYRLILAAEEGLDQLSQPQLAGGGFTKRIQAVLKDAKGESGMGLYRCNKPEHRYRPNKGEEGMEEVKIYNNGRGWRIAFSFQGARRVLTVEEATELKELLEKALAQTLSRAVSPGKKGENNVEIV